MLNRSLCVARTRKFSQRVSSSANVSDSVSRGDFGLAARMGWQRFDVDSDALLRGLLDSCLGPLRGCEGFF